MVNELFAAVTEAQKGLERDDASVRLGLLPAEGGGVQEVVRIAAAADEDPQVVRAGPFRDIASLGDFERAVGGIAGVQEAYVRSFAGDRRVVAVNFSDRALDFDLTLSPGATWRVQVASDGSGEGSPFRGNLGPSAAVVLTPDR